MSAIPSSATTRRFPSDLSCGAIGRASTGLVGIAGTPYRVLDRFSCLLMWATGLLAAAIVPL